VDINLAAQKEVVRIVHTIAYVGNGAADLAKESESPFCEGAPGQMEIGLLPCLFWLLFLTKKKSEIEDFYILNSLYFLT
jgi:hypothetical protein